MEEQKIRSGRKFQLTVIISLLTLLGYSLTVTHMELSKNFEEFCDTLVTVLFVYCGGNVGNKWLGASTAPAKPTKTSRKKTT
tara:strand:- start:199 stop:444 length:246 start_codon:yes stop_codon:yes gene_type:complete